MYCSVGLVVELTNDRIKLVFAGDAGMLTCSKFSLCAGIAIQMPERIPQTKNIGSLPSVPGGVLEYTDPSVGHCLFRRVIGIVKTAGGDGPTIVFVAIREAGHMALGDQPEVVLVCFPMRFPPVSLGSIGYDHQMEEGRLELFEIAVIQLQCCLQVQLSLFCMDHYHRIHRCAWNQW